MSYFGASIETLEKVIPHPNADKLDLGYMEGLGFQLVLPRDMYKAGDRVVYFPNDSVLTPALLEKFNLTGKLSGKNKDRLKIGKRIRGEYAEGLAGSLADVTAVLALEQPIDLDQDWNAPSDILGKDSNGGDVETTKLTVALGVLKYEPPEVVVGGQTAGSLPSHLSKYDIESTDRDRSGVEMLLETRVVVTEKLEGQNFAASIVRDGNGFRFYVCSRSQQLTEPTEEQKASGEMSTFWKNATRLGLQAGMQRFAEKLQLNEVTVYGEQVGPGIQGNIYKLGAHTVYFFDMRLDGRYVDAGNFEAAIEHLNLCCEGENLKTAPILFNDYSLRVLLDLRSIDDLATGNSRLLPGVLREGIVIKPVTEVNRIRGGRLIVKKRSLLYLENSSL